MGKCSEPNDEDLREQLLKAQVMNSQLHETFYLVPACRYDPHYITASGIRGPILTEKEKECPRPLSYGSTDPNVCQSGVVKWEVMDRYPRVLRYVACKCTQCSKSAACENIWHVVKVLSRKSPEECLGGKYVYALDWARVSVGCTCANYTR